MRSPRWRKASSSPQQTLRSVPDLVGPDLEAREPIGAERGADRHIGGIASARDEDAADARRVVAGGDPVALPARGNLRPTRGMPPRPAPRPPQVAPGTPAGARPDVHSAGQGQGKKG